MLLKVIKNKILKIKDKIKDNKKLLLYTFLIILFQLLMHFFVYSNIFKHLSFFCGDSPRYVYLANNLDYAADDRPSGFGFILHIIFSISQSPSVLIAFSVITSTLTSIFFFLTLRHLFKNKNLIPFLITIFFFLNPTITYIDSMVYMPDSFAFLLFSIGIFLILINPEKSKFNLRYLIAGLIFGYLTIVKSSFVYFFPFIILYIFYKIYKINREFSQKKLLGFLIILIIFISIPLSYMYLFNKPRLGVATLENFGGRSALANTLPYLSCEQLLSVATTDDERLSINANCDNKELSNLTAGEQLWIQNSPMNRMEGYIVHGYYRIQGNQLFQKWLMAILLKNPTIIFSPIKNTIINGYLGKVISRQISIKEPNDLNSGCETFFPSLFNMDRESYIKGWWLNQQNNKFNIDLLYFMQLYLTKITDWVIAILFLIFIPFYAIYKKVISSEFIFLYTISCVYVFIISFGSIYDTRYFIIFNYLILLTFFSLIHLKKSKEEK